MLVDTEHPPESKPEAAAPAPAHSHLRVRSDLHEEYSSDEIAKMTELYEGTLSNIEEGEIVKSKVLRVTDTAVILDVGFKSEGAVPIDEFKDAHSLKEGDEVEVFLEHLEDQEGAVVLSKKKADFMRVWERIREAHERDEAVSGTLVKKIKGGVVVDLMGVDAFLPGSQIALRRVPNIDELLGQSFDFKIIKLNKRRRNIVVSRRVLLEAERKTKRDVLMKELQVGQIRKGIVKNITEVGDVLDDAFADLTDLQLLHQDVALRLALRLEQHTARHHDVAASLVELDDLEIEALAQQLVDVGDAAQRDLTAGKERVHAHQVHDDAALDLLHQRARHGVVPLVGLADALPHPHEVGLLLREDHRAFLVLEVLEEYLDLVALLERVRVLELVDRHGAFGLESDVENDGGVRYAQHFRLDDLTLFDVRERPLVHLRHLRDFVRRILFVQIGANAEVGVRRRGGRRF